MVESFSRRGSGEPLYGKRGASRFSGENFPLRFGFENESILRKKFELETSCSGEPALSPSPEPGRSGAASAGLCHSDSPKSSQERRGNPPPAIPPPKSNSRSKTNYSGSASKTFGTHLKIFFLFSGRWARSPGRSRGNCCKLGITLWCFFVSPVAQIRGRSQCFGRPSLPPCEYEGALVPSPGPGRAELNRRAVSEVISPWPGKQRVPGLDFSLCSPALCI